MKEIRWDIAKNGHGEWILKDKRLNQVLMHDKGIVSATSILAMGSDSTFTTESEAQDYLEDLIIETPDLAYREIVPAFLDAKEVQELQWEAFAALVETTVAYLMENEKVFSRHDVLKSLRQLYGRGVEINYADWKELISITVDEFAVEFDYVKVYADGFWSYEPNDEVEADEEVETTTADSAETVTYDSDENDSVPSPAVKDTAEPAAVSNRHTVTAEQVRKCGGDIGDIMDIIVCKGRFFIEQDAAKNNADWVSAGSPQVLLSTSLKVDKNCNLRLSKYMFDLADLGQWFGSSKSFIC